MNIEKCIDNCKNKKFAGYAGLELGVQCFCSDYKPPLVKKKDLQECNTPCPGKLKIPLTLLDNFGTNPIPVGWVQNFSL